MKNIQDKLGSQLRRQLGYQLSNHPMGFHSQLERQLDCRLGSQLGSQLWSQLDQQLSSPLHDQLQRTLKSYEERALKKQVITEVKISSRIKSWAKIFYSQIIWLILTITW